MTAAGGRRSLGVKRMLLRGNDGECVENAGGNGTVNGCLQLTEEREKVMVFGEGEKALENG